jgi:hypothetical protein
MPLSESIAVLAATAPPGLSKKQALSNIFAKIVFLESRLGIPHSTFEFNQTKALARLTELESQLAAKGSTLAPAAALAPVPRSVELTGAATLDAAVAASGCHSLAQYRAKLKADRAFATATALPQGSLSRAAAEKNLGLALAEFRKS